MPNWCLTDITMVGTKENVTKLCDDLNRLLDINRKGTSDEWSFENESNWLGYVVQELLGDDWKCWDCRGIIEDANYTPFPMDDGSGEWNIQMCWSTAWCPCYQLQKGLAVKYDLKLYFFYEEEMMGLYGTNDKDGRIFSHRCKWGSDYYDSFEALATDFITEYGGEVRDVEHLKERMKNEITEEDEYGDCYNYFDLCKLVDDDGVFIKE